MSGLSPVQQDDGGRHPFATAATMGWSSDDHQNAAGDEGPKAASNGTSRGADRRKT
jgi:hypothetical protein